MPSHRTHTSYQYKLDIANTVQQWLRDPASVSGCSATYLRFPLKARAFVMHNPKDEAELQLPMAEFVRRGQFGDRYHRASCEVLGMWLEVDMFDETGGKDRCIM